MVFEETITIECFLTVWPCHQWFYDVFFFYHRFQWVWWLRTIGQTMRWFRWIVVVYCSQILVLQLNLFTWRVLSDQQIPKHWTIKSPTEIKKTTELSRDDLKQIQSFHFHSTCWLLFSLGCQLTVCGFWPELLLTKVIAERLKNQKCNERDGF